MATEFGALTIYLDRVSEIFSPPEMHRIMQVIGIQAEVDMLEAAALAVGTDLQFSGWKRLGRLGALIRVVGSELTVVPVPYGGWIVADKGRRPGAVAPRRRPQVTMATPWGPRTYKRSKPLRIGSSPGKNALTHGKELLRLRCPERVDRQIQLRIGRITT